MDRDSAEATISVVYLWFWFPLGMPPPAPVSMLVSLLHVKDATQRSPLSISSCPYRHRYTRPAGRCSTEPPAYGAPSPRRRVVTLELPGGSSGVFGSLCGVALVFVTFTAAMFAPRTAFWGVRKVRVCWLASCEIRACKLPVRLEHSMRGRRPATHRGFASPISIVIWAPLRLDIPGLLLFYHVILEQNGLLKNIGARNLQLTSSVHATRVEASRSFHKATLESSPGLAHRAFCAPTSSWDLMHLFRSPSLDESG